MRPLLLYTYGYIKKSGHRLMTAVNYLQNFGLTPFHITMSYDYVYMSLTLF